MEVLLLLAATFAATACAAAQPMLQLLHIRRAAACSLRIPPTTTRGVESNFLVMVWSSHVGIHTSSWEPRDCMHARLLCFHALLAVRRLPGGEVRFVVFGTGECLWGGCGEG